MNKKLLKVFHTGLEFTMVKSMMKVEDNQYDHIILLDDIYEADMSYNGYSFEECIYIESQEILDEGSTKILICRGNAPMEFVLDCIKELHQELSLDMLVNNKGYIKSYIVDCSNDYDLDLEGFVY